MGRLRVALLVVLLSALCLSSGEAQGPAPSSELVSAARKFIDSLAREDFTSAVERFDDTMKSVLPAEELEQAWRSVLVGAGAFKSQGDIRIEEQGQLVAVMVACQFERGAVDIRVVFNRTGEVAGLWLTPHRAAAPYEPPAYVNRDSFGDGEVTVGSDEWALPGSLSMPKGDGPFPAVVLVHGSGPHDRDETIGPNKPFCDLAWGLASRGVAVLRYEKRTKTHAEKVLPLKDTITVKEETVDDALVAVALLRRTERIDPAKLFVLGHSLGGMLAPQIGVRDPDIAGLVIMAGTTRPLEDVIVDQFSYVFSLDGVVSENEQATLDRLKEEVARVKDPALSAEVPAQELPLGAPARYWLALRGYDPPAAAVELLRPMLILQGGRDYQVTMADFEGWKRPLSSRPDVTFKLYPDLNHLFITGEGKSTPAEYNTSGHVAETVITDIADWIKGQ